MKLTPIVLLSLAAVAGCVHEQAVVNDPAPSSGPTATTQATSSSPTAEGAAQAEDLRSIASRYRKFTRVVDHPNVAPELCAAPPHHVPDLRLSQSTDTGSHGKKVYYLFASDSSAYLAGAHPDSPAQPNGQVLVKEAFVPEEAGAGELRDSVMIDGKPFKAGARGSLFVMARHDDKWQFGLVAPTGETTVEGPATRSCHGCHDGKPGGIFGLPPG